MLVRLWTHRVHVSVSECTCGYVHVCVCVVFCGAVRLSPLLWFSFLLLCCFNEVTMVTVSSSPQCERMDKVRSRVIYPSLWRGGGYGRALQLVRMTRYPDDEPWQSYFFKWPTFYCLFLYHSACRIYEYEVIDSDNRLWGWALSSLMYSYLFSSEQNEVKYIRSSLRCLLAEWGGIHLQGYWCLLIAQGGGRPPFRLAHWALFPTHIKSTLLHKKVTSYQCSYSLMLIIDSTGIIEPGGWWYWPIWAFWYLCFPIWKLLLQRIKNAENMCIYLFILH